MADFRTIDWQTLEFKDKFKEIWRNRALVAADVAAVLPDGHIATLGDLRGVTSIMTQYMSDAVAVDVESTTRVMAVCQIDDKHGCREYTKLLLNENLSVMCVVPKGCDWADLRKARKDIELSWP